MKIPDPCPIGRPAQYEPLILGYLSNHNLPKDLVIGTLVKINDKTYMVNVSYMPAKPKRERLFPLLTPKEEKSPSLEQTEFPF